MSTDPGYPATWGYVPEREPVEPPTGLKTGAGLDLPTHTQPPQGLYPANWDTTTPEPTPIDYSATLRKDQTQ